MPININVGILGHVDSGKTSLAKCLSEIASTAAFDKNPQSRERGITLDLGFSSFSVPLPDHLRRCTDSENMQYTLVDCPGHASLIKTIIGGAQIIDIMLLVVDVTKGIQTQTAECLIIGEITCKKMIIVLNKIDLLIEDKNAHIEKMKTKIKKTLSTTAFANEEVPIVSVSALSGNQIGIEDLINCMNVFSSVPPRNSEGPFVFAIDHCFGIKGQGTVMTGTILQGSVQVNDVIDVPQLGTTRKVRAMQMFKRSIPRAIQGDRLAICVTQFDPKLLERGIACTPNYGGFINYAIIKANLIKYYKLPIRTKSKFHVTIGHETALAEITVFYVKDIVEKFDFNILYEYKDEINVEDKSGSYYVLLTFEKPVYVLKNNLLIASKLDIDINRNICRLAFWGNVSEFSKEKQGFLDQLKIYKTKTKQGIIDRIVNDNTVIVKNMFSKDSDIQRFLNFTVKFSSGETGCIESSFGQSGKVKIYVPEGFKSIHAMKESKINVILEFKKYLYDASHKVTQ